MRLPALARGFLLAAIIAACLLACTGKAPAATSQSIRIGLEWGSGSIAVGGTKGALVVDTSGAAIGRIGEAVALRAEAGSVVIKGVGTLKAPVRIKAAEGATGPGYVTVSGRPYRGDLELLADDGLLTVVNVVSLEDYLLGVVSKEMPEGFPLEALKAQAVAARTYALYQMAGGTYRAKGFDVVPTTACQVYGGVWDERESGNRAVRETAGEILTYGGQPIAAYYFSSSGGHTESAEYVWGRKSPYLKGVPDYDQASPKYRWSIYVTRESLAARLDSAGCGVGPVTSIEGTGDPGPGGRFIYHKIEGSLGAVTIRTDRLRQILGLWSGAFEFVAVEERMENVTTALGSGPVVVVGAGEVTRSLDTGTLPVLRNETVGRVAAADARVVYPTIMPASFCFHGRGYGHGLGLSQYGARGMALMGKTYRDILHHYYTGVNLGTMP